MAKKLPLSIISTFTIFSVYGNPSNDGLKDKKESIFNDKEDGSIILSGKNFTDYSFIVSNDNDDYSPVFNQEMFIDDTSSKYENSISYLEEEKEDEFYEDLMETIPLDEDLYLNKFEPWHLGMETNFSLEEDFIQQINKTEIVSDYSEIIIDDDPYSEGISSSYIDYQENDIKDFGTLYLHQGSHGVFLMGNFEKDIKLPDSLKITLLNNNENEYEIPLMPIFKENNQVEFLENSSIEDSSQFIHNLKEDYNFKMYISYEDMGFSHEDKIFVKLLDEK